MKQGFAALAALATRRRRAIKRIVQPMLGFKSIRCARALVAGIETMHIVKRVQLHLLKNRASSAPDKFYSLAFWGRPTQGVFRHLSAVATEAPGIAL